VRRAAKGIAWEFTALAPALDAARAKRKPILALFDQDNCPPCALLKRLVLRAPAFVRAVEDAFVTVNLNACTDLEVAKRYQLRGTPTLLVLDSDGTVLGSQVGVGSLTAGLQLLERAASLARPKAKKYF
jgi:thioredoxin-related protein